MRKYILLLVLSLCFGAAFSQKNVIDKIIAIVGDEIILKSEVETEFLQSQSRGVISTTGDHKSQILEEKLIQKLLIAQAKKDSISVTETDVEERLTNHVDNLIQDIGSKERLERFFNKSVDELKNELRTPIREMLVAENMQMHIVDKLRTTPSEIRLFYKKLSKDSLPDVPDKYELQQIVVKPVVKEAEKERIRERLRTFREQIQNGEKTFNTLAVLYSDCPSAPKGGELGYSTKAGLAPEFAEAAFNLKPGKISKIVETEFGFHIVQLIDRQGEKVNVRHILLKPHIDEEAKEEARHRLDSVRNMLMEEKITFEEAAFYYSMDKKTKNNGGLLSTQNADSKIAKASIPGEMARVVNKLKVGQISEPFYQKSDESEEYKIIKMKAFYPQHKANLDDDWMNFEMMLKNQKQQELFEKWIREKQLSTYIHLDDTYLDSKFRYSGWIK